MTSLSGKVAVVTGASKGIGAAIAVGLARAGASVALNYSSDEAGAQQTAAKARGVGAKVIVVKGDVANPVDVGQLFQETRNELGVPSILVNNAGVFKFEPLAEIMPSEVHRQFSTNVLGPLMMSREALNYFPATGGSIINISSIASLSAIPNSSVYAATKAALDQITRSLAKELGPRNIRVNTVAPGHTNTEGLRSAGMDNIDVQNMVISLTPLGRVGLPEDIVPAVMFLASDEARWITGERIAPSGGLKF